MSVLKTQVFILQTAELGLDVDPQAAHQFITTAMDHKEFRFPQIREWIRSLVKPIED